MASPISFHHQTSSNAAMGSVNNGNFNFDFPKKPSLKEYMLYGGIALAALWVLHRRKLI